MKLRGGMMKSNRNCEHEAMIIQVIVEQAEHELKYGDPQVRFAICDHVRDTSWSFLRSNWGCQGGNLARNILADSMSIRLMIFRIRDVLPTMFHLKVDSPNVCSTNYLLLT